MAKVALKAGAEIDFLTDAELRKSMDHLLDRFEESARGQVGETITDQAPLFKTNSAGTGSGDIYQVPVGFDFFLTRLTINWPTSTVKTGGVKADVRICADTIRSAYTVKTLNTKIPSTYEASKSHAPLFRGGQKVVVSITGATSAAHTKTIAVNFQGILVPRRQVNRGHDTLAGE